MKQIIRNIMHQILKGKITHPILKKTIFKYGFYQKSLGANIKKIKIFEIDGFGVLARSMINEKRTYLKEDRLYILWQTVKQTADIDGDVAEIGVFRGGSSKFIVEALKRNGVKNKRIYLFDTFKGMPDNLVREDKRGKGGFEDTSFETVKKYLSSYSNIIIYKGMFEDNYRFIADKKFSMVHIDVDIYNSAKNCLNFFNSHLNIGGIIVLDDYGFITCPGIRKALNEFLLKYKKSYIFFDIETGQGLLIKK